MHRQSIKCNFFPISFVLILRNTVCYEKEWCAIIASALHALYNSASRAVGSVIQGNCCSFNKFLFFPIMGCWLQIHTYYLPLIFSLFFFRELWSINYHLLKHAGSLVASWLYLIGQQEKLHKSDFVFSEVILQQSEVLGRIRLQLSL